MIGALVRRLLCRAGRHDVLRCAGAEDHRWTHDGTQWVATLDRVPPLTPADRAALDAVTAQTRTAAEVAERSAALPCRCGDRQDQHRTVTAGGCTACPCPGFALTPREELDLHRAAAPRHRSPR